MRKYLTYIITIIISLVLVVIFVVHIYQQSNEILKLQEQKENIESNYKKLQLDYVELKQQIVECESANEELTRQLDEQKRIIPEGWQPFLGWWTARRYYETEAEREQGCCKRINIQRNFIIISGKNHLTDEPIYDIAVRIRSDVIDELKSVGVEDENIINMLQAECYAEMTFSNTCNWKRELLPVEVDLVENAKYYIIDNLTMLCVSKNNGGRLYVLSRIGVND